MLSKIIELLFEANYCIHLLRRKHILKGHFQNQIKFLVKNVYKIMS